MKSGKIRLVSAVLLALVMLATVHPAAAGERSSDLVKDLESAGEVFTVLKYSLPRAIGTMKSLEAYVEAMIEADRLADDGIEIMGDGHENMKFFSSFTRVYRSRHAPRCPPRDPRDTAPRSSALAL